MSRRKKSKPHRCVHCSKTFYILKELQKHWKPRNEILEQQVDRKSKNKFKNQRYSMSIPSNDKITTPTRLVSSLGNQCQTKLVDTTPSAIDKSINIKPFDIKLFAYYKELAQYTKRVKTSKSLLDRGSK